MLKIAKIAIPIALEKEFDYSFSSDLNLKKGTRVLVDFNHKKRVGIVSDLKQRSNIRKIKPIIDVLDAQPSLTEENIRFSRSL